MQADISAQCADISACIPAQCALLLNNKYDRRLIRIRDDENQCPGLIAGVTVTLSKKDIHFFRYIEGLLLPLIPC